MLIKFIIHHSGSETSGGGDGDRGDGDHQGGPKPLVYNATGMGITKVALVRGHNTYITHSTQPAHSVYLLAISRCDLC
jgi:hypothetical protein